MSTRVAILSAAARHLNRHPEAPMADLAAAAGVGRATIHRHFATREELLHELGARSLDRWHETLDVTDADAAAASGDAERITTALRELLVRYVADSDDFGFALTDTYLVNLAALRERTRALEDRETAFLAAAQQAGVLRDDVPARWLSHLVYGLLVAARDADLLGTVARRDLDHLVLTSFLTGGGSQ